MRSQPVARRTFLTGSLAAAAGLAALENVAAGKPPANDTGVVYELRPTAYSQI